MSNVAYCCHNHVQYLLCVSSNKHFRLLKVDPFPVIIYIFLFLLLLLRCKKKSCIYTKSIYHIKSNISRYSISRYIVINGIRSSPCLKTKQCVQCLSKFDSQNETRATYHPFTLFPDLHRAKDLHTSVTQFTHSEAVLAITTCFCADTYN